MNIPGLKIPLRATSIIPLEVMAPKNTPILAIIMMFLIAIAFEPIAEFKKFTASLLTPTTKSTVAKIARQLTLKYMDLPCSCFYFYYEFTVTFVYECYRYVILLKMNIDLKSIHKLIRF